MPTQLNTASFDRFRNAPLSLCSDEFLARRASRGDDRAFAQIYQRYEEGLYRYCRSLVKTAEDADDVMQSAMWLALRALDNGTRPLAIKPWLYRIVHNESISLLRRRRPDVELFAEQPNPAVAADHESPHAELTSRATVRTLFADLKQLTEQQRAVLVMRELNDFSADDIAQQLGITPQGVRQSLYEARRSLQEFEEGRALDCELVQRQIEEGDGRKLASRKLLAHLRDCRACEGFKAAVTEPPKRARLAAFAPAALPGVVMSWFGSIFGAGSGAASAGGAGAGLSVAGSTAAGVVGAKGLAIATAAVLAAGVGSQIGSGVPGNSAESVGHAQIDVAKTVPALVVREQSFDPLAAQRRQTQRAREAAQRRAKLKAARRRAADRRAQRRAVARQRDLALAARPLPQRPSVAQNNRRGDGPSAVRRRGQQKPSGRERAEKVAPKRSREPRNTVQRPSARQTPATPAEPLKNGQGRPEPGADPQTPASAS